MNEVLPYAAHKEAAASAGLPGLVSDWSSDRRAFKDISWGKAMMWVFLLSDTFVFGSFLIAYMTVRISTTVPWPNPSEVFALEIAGHHLPLILIAIMTFVLISSSGTMAMAVNFGYRRDRRKTAMLLLLTALLGAAFVGMQAFEWSKLISEGVRPWENPWGAAQFGADGAVAAAGAAGLADAHAGALAGAGLAAQGAITADTAVLAATAALGSNLLVKGVLAFVAGGRRFGAGFVAGMALPALAYGAVLAAANLLS